LQWIQDHSPEEIAERMPASFMPEHKGTYIEALRSSRPMYSPDGRTTYEAAAGAAAILALALPDQGVRGVDLSKTYTNAFLDQ
jgi:NitT/TauT family transport system substrate-binding protein